MNSVKKCFVTVGLITMMAATTLADCPNPGEVTSPPCSASQQQITDDPPVPATMSTPSSEVEIISSEAVIEALKDLLTVY
jgi:hypothetical protein